MATNHESSQTSKCNTPSPTSSEYSFSDYGSARRLTRKADRVNIKKDEDKGDGDDFRLDLDFDRDDDEDGTHEILVQEPYHEHENVNVCDDSILDLDFDKDDQLDTHEIIVQEPCQVFHELDIEIEDHDDNKQALEPTSSINFSDKEKALDEWGFDATLLLGSIEPIITIVPNDMPTISSDPSSNDERDEDNVSNCVSEESTQSSDASCFESSQELNDSNYVHSQIPNFAPSNSKRISKPPCDRFVTYTIESMIDDDDDDEDDDVDDDDDEHDDDDDVDDEEANVEYDDDDDEEEEDDDDEEEDEEYVQRKKCFKRKRI